MQERWLTTGVIKLAIGSSAVQIGLKRPQTGLTKQRKSRSQYQRLSVASWRAKINAAGVDHLSRIFHALLSARGPAGGDEPPCRCLLRKLRQADTNQSSKHSQ